MSQRIDPVETMREKPTINRMGQAQWVKEMKRLWIARGHFCPCANCGSAATFKSVNPAQTQGTQIWCYDCGSTDSRVTGRSMESRPVKKRVPMLVLKPEYQPKPLAPLVRTATVGARYV